MQELASQAYAVAYFLTVLVLVLLESAAPRRATRPTLGQRWAHHFALTMVNAILTRSLFPLAEVAWALLCQQYGFGIFYLIPGPPAAAVVLSVLALDLVAYQQHRLLHAVPWLWRVHRTHHSDHEFDFTTGVRFHPLEVAVTNVTRMATIALLGAPPVAVIAAQLTTMAIVLFEHANVRIAAPLDRVLRTVVVTPDMHRVHHSQAAGESRANLSAVFSFWDRLFGTYLEQPAAGHDGVAFGLAEFPGRKHLTLPWMLAQPFLSEGDQVELGTAPGVERPTRN